MNRRTLFISTLAAAGVAFAGGAVLYNQFGRQTKPAAPDPMEAAGLVRAHSPVMGPTDASVTIVEFFDPSCEACRAFYPIVKQIMDIHAGKVKLVLRYAAFHEGSDEVVRIIEAARLQYKFTPILEALLAHQPEWAVHGAPDLEKAWEIAGTAGLDLTRARTDAQLPEISEVLRLDAEDAAKAGVKQTPTFFVNGEPLDEFGPQQLYDLVTQEVETSPAG